MDEPLAAQVPDHIRQQRRQFVGDLLKTLIESQQDDHHDDRHEGHSHVRPHQPGGVVPPTRPVPATAELIQLRQNLARFGAECDHLISALQSPNQAVQSRALLADAMHLKARSDSLIHYANRTQNHREIIPAYQQLDQAWRVLAHRVRKAGGIDSSCLKHVGNLTQYGNAMCSGLGIQPAMNRGELVRLMSSMNLSFQHLLQDLYYDNRSKAGITEVIREGQILHGKIRQASAVVETEPYDSLVLAYKGASKEWRRYARKLRPYQSDRVRRDIQEIETLGHSIHEHLWLTEELDAEDVLDISRSIDQDAHKLFETISLEDLLKTENPGQLLATAREFHRTGEAFANSFKNGFESWVWDFQLFNVQWKALQQQSSAIQNPRVAHRLNQMAESMIALNQMLGQGPSISREDLLQLTAKLDQLAVDLNYGVRRIQQPLHRQQLTAHSEQFHHAAHDVHESLVLNRHQTGMHKELTPLFQSWHQMKKAIALCSAADRSRLNTYRRQIEPIMVKLQVVFPVNGISLR